MKRFLAIISATLMAISISTASFAGVGIGLTGNWTTLDTSGSETQRDSGDVASTEVSEDVAIPEMFIEFIADNNFTIGVSYVPVQELGSSSRTDTDLVTATNTASAELADMVRMYVDIPIWNGAYITGGVSNTTIVTTENLGTGSSYDDEENVFGYSYGLGYKSMLGGSSNWYYKAEYILAEYDAYEDTSDGSNKVTADTESSSAKVSVAYQF